MRNPYSTPRPRRTAAGVVTTPPRPQRRSRPDRPDTRPVVRGAALAFRSSSDGATSATLADLARLVGDDSGAAGTALTYQLLRQLLADPSRRVALAKLAARRPTTSAGERKLIADLRDLLGG